MDMGVSASPRQWKKRIATFGGFLWVERFFFLANGYRHKDGKVLAFPSHPPLPKGGLGFLGRWLWEMDGYVRLRRTRGLVRRARRELALKRSVRLSRREIWGF
jgi:hypothetical protein